MTQEELIKLATRWLETYPMGRDRFIYTITTLKNDGIDLIKVNDKYIQSEPWMDSISNPRKTYETIKGIKTCVEKTESTKEKLTKTDENRYIRQIQKLRDDNNRLRRIQRNTDRRYIQSDSFFQELKEYYDCINIPQISVFTDEELSNCDAIGIVQLSDLHLNELINEPNNVYDFRVASKRLKKYAQEITQKFMNEDVCEVHIVNTGDNINSDRRNSEKVNMATSRARACVLATKLLVCFINDLSANFKINVSFVSSNESRIGEEMSMDELSASDNFDIIIYEMLKMFYINSSAVKFIDCDLVEGIVSIGSKKILITHGYHIPDNGLQKTIQTIKGKYASRDILIDYIIFGDKHSCYISDKFARSGSLCGGNGYSDLQLSFDSTPSQNIYILNRHDNTINGIRIGLDKTNNSCYDIEEELSRMNVKCLTVQN